MRFLPLHFRIDGVPVLFVGGGKVNERRIKRLIDYGAKITLVSPNVTEELKKLSEAGKINWIKGKFEEAVLKEKFLFAFVAVDKNSSEIIESLKSKNILVENASSGTRGDFIFPAIVDRGNLIISISSSGKDPSLTKIVKEMLENWLRDLKI